MKTKTKYDVHLVTESSTLFLNYNAMQKRLTQEYGYIPTTCQEAKSWSILQTLMSTLLV